MLYVVVIGKRGREKGLQGLHQECRRNSQTQDSIIPYGFQRAGSHRRRRNVYCQLLNVSGSDQ
jgi:hypothetical protein